MLKPGVTVHIAECLKTQHQRWLSAVMSTTSYKALESTRPKTNSAQTKSAQSQLGPKPSRPKTNSAQNSLGPGLRDPFTPFFSFLLLLSFFPFFHHLYYALGIYFPYRSVNPPRVKQKNFGNLENPFSGITKNADFFFFFFFFCQKMAKNHFIFFFRK